MSLIEPISLEARESIDRVLTKFPADKKKSAILEGLHILQDQNGGFLTSDLQTALAEYLGVSKVEVYEVAEEFAATQGVGLACTMATGE